MTVALLPIPNLLNIEPRIWFMLHNTTAGKKTSDKGAVVVLNVVTTETKDKMETLLKTNCLRMYALCRIKGEFYRHHHPQISPYELPPLFSDNIVQK